MYAMTRHRAHPGQRKGQPAVRREAVSLRFAAIGLISLSLTMLPRFSSAQQGTMLDLCAFRPTFFEDFNSLSVSAEPEDHRRWFAHTPWGGDFGDASFTDPQADFPFSVRDGILRIEARKGTDNHWRSGLLASAYPDGSGFAQRYGYFESRIKLPPGPGTWPGFWLNANMPRGSKAPGVEIDVLEYYGQFPAGFHSALHIWDLSGGSNNRVTDHVTPVANASLYRDFHQYGVDVEPDWLTFYLDRAEIWRVATPAELTMPLMVLVDLALGSGWPIDRTPNPSIMQIDYVHVYERDDSHRWQSCR
jgi:beta-glucanase (GH16 family)